MLIQYQTFYRRYGVRLPSQLAAPPVGRLELLDLPRESIYHYYGVGPTDEGPTERLNPLKNNNRAFSLETVLELTENLGSPRRVPMDSNRLVREHRIKNPRFRPFKDVVSAERDPMSLIVVNYAFIPRFYRYQRSYYSTYYSQYNFMSTVWTKMAEWSKVSDRNQFIEFDLPEILPTVAQLRSAENTMTQKLAAMFSYAETITILAIWQWLGVDRSKSFISKIPDDRLGRINIIFKESNRWIMFNLGLLNSWRAATKEELEQNPNANDKGEMAGRMQARFLRTLMSLFEARTLDVPENLGDQDTKVIDDAGDVKKDGTNTGNATVSQTDEPIQETKPTEGVAPVTLDTSVFQANFADIEADLEKLEEINHQILIQNQNAENELEDPSSIKPKTHEEAILALCNQLAENGALSASEYRKYTEGASNYKNIKVGNTTLGEMINIPKEVLQIKESPTLPDKSTIVDKTMLKSSLLVFDKKYVEEVLQRDVAAMVTNLQQAGVVVQDYNVEEVDDITGTYFAYTVKVKPLQGAVTTLRFKIPKVRPDGTWKAGNVLYVTRKQRGDVPIRKIGPNRVALTSYYGKMFVDRSEKKVNDYGRWLRDAIMAAGLDNSSDVVTELVPGNSFDNKFKSPKLYSSIAFGFRSFKLKIEEEPGKINQWSMVFDHKARIGLVKEDKRQLLESSGDVIVGISDDGRIAVMGDSGKLYWVDEGNPEGRLVELPSFEDIFKLDLLKAPVDYSELRVLGKNIPMGVVLGYLLGLDRLLKRLQVTPRIVPAGQRSNLQPHEWSIVFQDETWIFNREDALASLVLAGWRDFDQTTRQFNAHEFSRRDVYLNVLEENDLGIRYLREMDLANQLFIDPIAKGLLEEMNEPTVYTELLLRSCELLVTDDHPDELDSRYMRIKGYERFAGMLYTELVRSMRVHNGRSNKSLHPLELNPYAVWIAISDDPAKNQVSEINPIQNLKEQEAVTYSGTGGRMGRSLVKRTRAYHPSDMGVISEATVDSSDVAINTYLSADPQFNSLRGTANPYEIGKTGATALFSTSALVSVAAVNDDPKRVNFISIQHRHGVACEGYRQSPVRTGYEQVIGERTGDMFCVTAKVPGKVVSVSDQGIVVENENGERIGVELGRRYGSASGLTIPHHIVTTLKVGDVVKVGDAIAYNNGFFEPDVLNPKQVIWKSSLLVNTVLMEAASTLEDSSEISSRVSESLKTKITKVRTIVVGFNQQVHKLVKAGDFVEYESILCMIEDAVSAGSGLLTDSQIDTLRLISAQSPLAKSRGVIERVEMYYHGDKEDMSSSLLALSEQSDSQIAKRYKAVGKKAVSGSVNEDFRIENEPLLLDTAAIQIYITSEIGASAGDKGVFANQMKTVFGGVFDENVRTESGVAIDAIFGAKSVDDRIVLSPYVIGTTNTLLDVIGKKALQAYKS